MNTYFEKRQNKGWTWHSPCFDQFNELDYVLCDDRRSITNVEVLGRFVCDSDHRSVRATILLWMKRLKKSLAFSSQKRATVFDEKALQRAVGKAQWTTSGRTNERYEQVTATLTSCLEAVEVPKKKDPLAPHRRDQKKPSDAHQHERNTGERRTAPLTGQRGTHMREG
ncbi:endonuclease-reverse transcriptase [Aphelenchoides avenae]|nr:endonuclease-reverse transcriptase [Aphelenchus avenae]